MRVRVSRQFLLLGRVHPALLPVEDYPAGRPTGGFIAGAGALVALNAEICRRPGEDALTAIITDWVRSLLAGRHPAAFVHNYLVTAVTKAAGGEIVSSLALIHETWSYGGVPFGVRRVGFVGPRPDH